MHSSGSTTECQNGGICMLARGSRQKRSSAFRAKVLSFSSPPAVPLIESSVAGPLLITGCLQRLLELQWQRFQAPPSIQRWLGALVPPSHSTPQGVDPFHRRNCPPSLLPEESRPNRTRSLCLWS